MADDRLTWLHCSDFHVGKDRIAQERLLGRIVEHLQERVATGAGLVGEPGFTGSGSRPMQVAAIAHPVSVCHQWSITGRFNAFCAHSRVSGSVRSPARNRVSNFDRS